MSDIPSKSVDERLTEILEAPRKPKPTPLQLATVVLLFLLLLIGIYNTNVAARQAADAASAAEADSKRSRDLLESIESIIVDNRFNDDSARVVLREAVDAAADLVRSEGRARDEELLAQIEGLIARLEGPAGSAGLSGIQGAQGTPGADGEKGEKGDPGDDGPMGIEGPAGPPPPPPPPPPPTTTTTLPPPPPPPICGSPQDPGTGPCTLP